MSSPDFSKRSYPNLMKLSKKLAVEIAAKRLEGLKVLVDGYAKKAAAAGFTAAEVADALKPYVQDEIKSPIRHANEQDVVYRDSANAANVWGGRGRPPKWLSEYEHQGRRRAEFKVQAPV